MRHMRTFLLVVGCIIAIVSAGCEKPPSTTITDKDLRIWRNTLSPDGRSRIVIYQRDTGAFGYGRVFWAVTPTNLDGTDLAKFILPDGFRAEGYTKDNELELSKWQPYYGIRDSREIRDGDLFNGIKVKMIVNNSEYSLPGYKEPTSSQ